MSRDRTELASASEEAKGVIKLLPAASALVLTGRAIAMFDTIDQAKDRLVSRLPLRHR
jgi:hypothetical protein